MSAAFASAVHWVVKSLHCVWFAETRSADQVRALWPQLTGSPEQYIACFETLAQLALAMTARNALTATQPQSLAQKNCGAQQNHLALFLSSS